MKSKLPANRLSWLLYSTTFVVVGLERSPAQELDTSNTVRDLRAGQERLARYEQEAATWECAQSAASNGKDDGSSSSVVKRASAGVLRQTKKGVICRNEGAMFAVEKSKGSGSWALLKYQRTDVENGWRRQVDKDHPIYYPLQAQRGEFTTLQMLDDPEFKPTRARRVAPDRVELDYIYRLPASEQGNRTKVDGTLTLATDLDWLVVKSVSHAAETPLGYPVDSVLIRDAERAGEVIRAKSVTMDFIHAETKKAFNTRKYTFKYLSSETVDPAEFTIEYYNLVAPDHDVYEDRGVNWLLWGGIGVGCIALSVFLGWFIHRRMRRPS